MTPAEAYIQKHPNFAKELNLLRSLCISTELTETIKWGVPTYTIDRKNVLGLAAFKTYCGVWFFNGVFLKDKANVLINAQEGKTKAMRQWRFSSINDIDKKLVLEYIIEAINNQKLGKGIKIERLKKEIVIPELLLNALTNQTEIQKGYNSLSPYKQREYCEYIATAKRKTTKQSRLEKIKPMLIKGIGLNDKYRDC